MSSFGAFGGGSPFGSYGNSGGTSGNGQYTLHGNLGGFNDYAALFQGMPGMNQPPPTASPYGPYADLFQNIQPQAPEGYNYNPATGMYQMQAGGSFQNPFASVTYHRAPSSGGFTDYQTMMGLLMGDAAAAGQANQFNYQQNLSAANQALAATMEGAQGIREAGQTAAGQLTDFAGQLSGIGANRAEEIVAEARRVEEEGKIEGSTYRSAAAYGLVKNYGSEIQQLDSRIKATGDPMLIAQKEQLIGRRDAEVQAQQTEIFRQNQQFNAALGQNVVQAMIAGAGTEAQYNTLASNLHQAGANMISMMELEAAKHESMGNWQYAQFIQSNPFSNIAFAPLLATLTSYGQIEGVKDLSLIHI